MGTIEMSAWQEFGLERGADMMPAADLEARWVENVPQAGKKGGGVARRVRHAGARAPNELLAATTSDRRKSLPTPNSGVHRAQTCIPGTVMGSGVSDVGAAEVAADSCASDLEEYLGGDLKEMHI